jgi:hypothetical protein
MLVHCLGLFCDDAVWCCAVLCRTLPLCESSREDVLDSIATFVNPRRGQAPYHCLIISYETFRLHAARLAVPGACDLLICDEVGGPRGLTSWECRWVGIMGMYMAASCRVMLVSWMLGDHCV